MTNKIDRFIVLACTLLFILLMFIPDPTTAVNNEKNKKGAQLQLPIIVTASDIKYHNLKDGLIRGVSYKAKIGYPGGSRLILDYYDSEMKKLGFTPYAGRSKREWSEFVDGTIKGEPDVAQLTAEWVDNKRTVTALLVVRYYWYIDRKQAQRIKPINDDMNVTFQFMIANKNKIGI